MGIVRRFQKASVRVWLWFKERAQKPYAQAWLTAYSAVETIVVPFPVDPFMIAVLFTDVRRWKYFAFLTTLGSFVGAVLGYCIGLVAFETLGHYLLALSGAERGFEFVRSIFDENSFLLIFAAALTPIPNVVIPAGFLKVNFFLFCLAWIIGRSIRFFAVAYIVYAYGTTTLNTMNRYLNIGTVIFLVIALGWVSVRLLGLG